MNLPTITELIRELDAEDDGRFLYRGQSRVYPTVLPSATRNVAVPIPNDPPAYFIPRGRQYAEETVRQSEQQRLRHAFTQRMGVSVGNLLAQQYLVSSDVIDATSRPTVAGFFATRRLPRAEHINSQDVPGVIYRWRKPDPARTLLELRQDLSLGQLTSIDEPERDPIPTRFVVASPESDEARWCRDMPNGSLLLRPQTVSLDEIDTLVTGELQRTPDFLEVVLNEFQPFTGFPRSRWTAQSGGMIRPTLRYPAFVKKMAKGPNVATDDELDIDLDQSITVFITRPDVVVDSECFDADRFEFRHGADQVAADAPDELWPDIDSDPMFLWVSLLAWEAAEKYFEEVRANTPWDLWVGLVDRGYFRDPDDERELQREWKRFRELHEFLPGLGREYAR